MALLRKLVLLGVAVALMPSDKEQQDRFYERAASAVHWTTTFCDRNVEICDQGQTLWATFVKKAEFGAEMAYTLVQQHVLPATLTRTSVPDNPGPTQGTLRPEDFQPGWRGHPEVRRQGT